MAAVGLVCGPLWKYSSSDKNGTNEPNLNSYTTACEEDPELKSFDSSLDQGFNKLKSELAAGGKTENYSLNSVKSLCAFLVELNKKLAESITGSNDILENEELRSLVDLYYESSTKTLDLFNTVENCTKKAKLSLLIIQVAIKQFEKESMDDTDFEGNLKKKKTLEELNKVKAMGDPFGDEYKNQMKSVREEHLVLLEKYQEIAVKLDVKKGKLKRRRRLATILSAAAAGVGTGLNYVIGTAGELVNELMKNREKDLDRQKDVVNMKEDNKKVTIEGTNTISTLIEKLITSLSLIQGSAEIAVVKKEEEALKPVMEAVLCEVEAFATAIKEVGEAVATCSTCVASGKVQVLEHITNSMSSKGNK